MFDEDTSIYPPPHVTNKEGEKSIDYRFIECVFNKDVSVESYGLLKENSSNIFRNCNFEENISIRNSKINGNLFNFYNYYSLSYDLQKNWNNPNNFLKKLKDVYTFKNILIINSELEQSFKLNGFNSEDINKYREVDNFSGYELSVLENILSIKSIEIIDSEFNSKVEIKNACIDSLIFNNSNVYGIFDINGSQVVTAHFYKSIFEEFAVFENVVFGDKKIESKTKFIYTTFKDFSNFRNTDFSSGLSFSNVNLKQEPNFLNTYVHPKETDRETFRIIKNSFEKSNNKIEAGKYHAYEMSAYINELSFRKNFWQLTILYANNLISKFGQSYIRPFLLLIGFVVLYSYLLDSYQEVLQFRIHEMQYGLESFTENLNTGARNFLPFARFISDKRGFEFVSLFFYIVFAILIWQTIVAVKKQTQH